MSFGETLLVKRVLKVLLDPYVHARVVLGEQASSPARTLDPAEFLLKISHKMRLRDVQRLELPPSADMHVHLRQDQVNLHRPPVLDQTEIISSCLQVMGLVVPQILNGGVDTVFVMVCRSSNVSFQH